MQVEYEAATIDARGQIVRHCQLEKVFRQDQRKLTICLHHTQAWAVLSALRAAGATAKIGKGPMGYMERDLQEWLEAMEAA